MRILRWARMVDQRMLQSSYLGWGTLKIHQLVQTILLRPEREIVHQNQMTLAHFLSLESRADLNPTLVWNQQMD